MRCGGRVWVKGGVREREANADSEGCWMNTRRVQRRPVLPRRLERVLGEATRDERVGRVSWGALKTQAILFGLVVGGTFYARYCAGWRPKRLEVLYVRMSAAHSNFGCGFDVRVGPYNASAQAGWLVGDRVGTVQLVNEFQVYAFDTVMWERNWAVYIQCINLTNSVQAVLGHWGYREVEDLTQVVDPLRRGMRVG